MYREVTRLIRRPARFFPPSFGRGLPQIVSVILLAPNESERINRTYRGKNKAANILSFRYDSDYGEILLCPAVIRKEAARDGVMYKRQLVKMVVHGMVHLAGVHHEESVHSARRAERAEKHIMDMIFK